MAFLLGTTMTTVAQTAATKYLDVKQYATIDEVGWDYGYVDHAYYYNINETQGIAWLTLSFAGAYTNSTSWGDPDRNQNWIELSPAPPQYMTKGKSLSWEAVSAGYRSGGPAYFDNQDDTRAYGFSGNNVSNTTKYYISFYVTNTNKIRIYGKTGILKVNGVTYPAGINLYECTLDNNGQPIQPVKISGDSYVYNTNSTTINYISSDLDVHKIYKVECYVVKSRFMEIAFGTPYSSTSIDVTPTNLDFETFVGESASKIINVKGTSLQGDITATITDDNGNVFSVPATISQADASASDGTDVTVTFSPTQAGTYTGTLTLSSPGANDVTIPLTGKANNYFPVNITSVGLTTLYLDSPLKIPYDEYEPNILGVYYIYGLNGKELLSARLDNTIPAKTGVIIQGNSGEYKFPIIEEADPLPSVAPNSLLSGCLVNTPVSTVKEGHEGAKIYTLGRGKDSFINFYQYSGQTLNANKAFFLLEGAGNAKELSVRFDDQATGIRTASTLVDDGAWYTIQGIRLQGEPAAKGLYIHNGKTIVVK